MTLKIALVVPGVVALAAGAAFGLPVLLHPAATPVGTAGSAPATSAPSASTAPSAVAPASTGSTASTASKPAAKTTAGTRASSTKHTTPASAAGAEPATAAAPTASASATTKTPTATTTATTKAPTTTPAKAPAKAATPADPKAAKAVARFVTAAVAPTSDGPDLDALQNAVSGAALDELQAQQLELEENDQHIEGRATASDVQLVRSGNDGTVPTARIRACIDSSAVRVVDAKGVPVTSTTTGTQRALNLYDLRFEQGAWVVVRHTFPADTAC